MFPTFTTASNGLNTGGVNTMRDPVSEDIRSSSLPTGFFRRTTTSRRPRLSASETIAAPAPKPDTVGDVGLENVTDWADARPKNEPATSARAVRDSGDMSIHSFGLL